MIEKTDHKVNCPNNEVSYLNNAIGNFRTFSLSKDDLKRMKDNMSPDLNKNCNKKSNKRLFKNLFKHFYGINKTIIDEVNDANMFMYLGLNGCGMTTHLWRQSLLTNGIFITSEYPNGWDNHPSLREKGQKKDVLDIPEHLNEYKAIADKYLIMGHGISSKEMIATISSAITAIRCNIPLFVDGFATFLHTKNQHKLIRIMKEIIAEYPDLKFIFSTHRHEMIYAFSYDIEEKNLIKNGYIVEGNELKSTPSTWEELLFVQHLPNFLPGSDPHAEGCPCPAEISFSKVPPDAIHKQFHKSINENSIEWVCPNKDCRRTFFFDRKEIPETINIKG
jgi:hypothetical protein